MKAEYNFTLEQTESFIKCILGYPDTWTISSNVDFTTKINFLPKTDTTYDRLKLSAQLKNNILLWLSVPERLESVNAILSKGEIK